MAKYGRFDPRNKKRGKHKSQSIDKDFRIRDADRKKVKMKYEVYDEKVNEWQIQTKSS